MRKEAISILESLEETFYDHWGSVESTAPYARLREEHLPILREMVNSNGTLALMALRVLQKRSPGERFPTSVRAIIYWSGFQRETCFNRWGVISARGFLPGIYGQELLELGPEIVPYLQRSLRDDRRAPVVGGEEERTSRIQADRICDYAWVLLAALYHRPVDYNPDPRLRDPQIHALDLWIDRRGK